MEKDVECSVILVSLLRYKQGLTERRQSIKGKADALLKELDSLTDEITRVDELETKFKLKSKELADKEYKDNFGDIDDSDYPQ